MGSLYLQNGSHLVACNVNLEISFFSADDYNYSSVNYTDGQCNLNVNIDERTRLHSYSSDKEYIIM